MKQNRFIQKETRGIDPLWHVQLAVLGAIVLQMVLPDRVAGGFKYDVVILEAVLLISLIVTTPRVPVFESVVRRLNSVGLVLLVTLANIYSLVRVSEQLLTSGHVINGQQLILASINIYLTNIIIFGLWYWEMDGGGPGRRRRAEPSQRDFLFPQTATPEISPKGWSPTFPDYLYVSATNATAFSPTDTMPLTHRAKLLMLVQSIVALITIALVAARAVNILS